MKIEKQFQIEDFIKHSHSYKKYLVVENVMYDSGGRAKVFEISGVTFGNIYLPSGTDNTSRSKAFLK